MAAPGNLLLLAKNRLESAASVTVTSEAAGRPVSRLYDGDRGPQWRATSNAVQDIDLAQGPLTEPFSHVALVNYALNTGIEIYRGPSFPPSTLALAVASLAGGDPYIADLGGMFTDRFIRVRILGGGSIAAIGELVVGAAQIVAMPPGLRTAMPATIANVRRDVSPAGYTWSVRRGPKRARLPYGWNALTASELAAITTAFDETNQGAKTLIVRDELGATWWVYWETQELKPVALGAGLYELQECVFEEAL